MDDRRFDSLVKSLARGANRRDVLRGLLGVSGAAIAGVAVSDDRAEAARRGGRTPKPVSCPGQQTPVDGACVCPDGLDKCGPDCCEPGVSECCDNACCYGTCYGEELCCPTGNIVCNGECIPGECCVDADCSSSICDERHTCVCVASCPEGYCGNDGCGGTCSCGDGMGCNEHGVCQECFVCGAEIPVCGASGPFDLCLIACDSNGVVACVENQICSDYADCTTNEECSVGQHCVFQSCCDGGQCMNPCGTSGASSGAVEAADGQRWTAAGYFG